MADHIKVTLDPQMAAMFGAAGSAGVAPAASGFRISPEDVPAVRVALKDAIVHLTKAIRAATQMRVVATEGVNPVVDKYVSALVDRAAGDTASVASAADSAINAYQSVIDQLDAAMEAYRLADDPAQYRS